MSVLEDFFIYEFAFSAAFSCLTFWSAEAYSTVFLGTFLPELTFSCRPALYKSHIIHWNWQNVTSTKADIHYTPKKKQKKQREGLYRQTESGEKLLADRGVCVLCFLLQCFCSFLPQHHHFVWVVIPECLNMYFSCQPNTINRPHPAGSPEKH